jgi:hypothetical protein
VIEVKEGPEDHRGFSLSTSGSSKLRIARRAQVSHLGKRMVAGNMDRRSAFIRELPGQDLKLEIEQRQAVLASTVRRRMPDRTRLTVKACLMRVRSASMEIAGSAVLALVDGRLADRRP